MSIISDIFTGGSISRVRFRNRGLLVPHWSCSASGSYGNFVGQWTVDVSSHSFFSSRSITFCTLPPVQLRSMMPSPGASHVFGSLDSSVLLKHSLQIQLTSRRRHCDSFDSFFNNQEWCDPFFFTDGRTSGSQHDQLSIVALSKNDFGDP